jgi:signal transduction histidine kinase
MTDNFRKPTTRRPIALEAQHVEALRETVDQLRGEVAELRESRERLMLAADAERRTIERDLHDGVQQRLVALSVSVQLARQAAERVPAATATLLDELERDIRHAIEETTRLAEQIYPPLLEAGGLLAALRSAAVRLGGPVRIEVSSAAPCPPEVARTVYFCCVQALENGGAGASVSVHDVEGALAFEVVAAAPPARLDLLRDRVEALGGSLTTRSDPGGATFVTGSLPLSRWR